MEANKCEFLVLLDLIDSNNRKKHIRKTESEKKKKDRDQQVEYAKLEIIGKFKVSEMCCRCREQWVCNRVMMMEL